MILYPNVQCKAQCELDEVIGADRLPTFEDHDSLPYMNSICKEIQRWRPVVPLGVAHRLMEDDVYNNNFIPRGSVVSKGQCSMTRICRGPILNTLSLSICSRLGF
ncbi:cytochrome P450 [Gautieria morchelliformis]|nr:cytochrome P450 [Gautieria morchelliformis]